MSHLISSFYESFDPERYRHDHEPSNLHLMFEFGLAFEQCMEKALQGRYLQSTDPTVTYERPDEQVYEEFEYDEDGNQVFNEDGTPVYVMPPILYNPDLFIVENGVFRVGEIKLTWKSTKGIPEQPGEFFSDKFAKYETQLKLYCRCLECVHGRLIICFVNADWKKHGIAQEMGPVLHAFDYTFTRQELEEEWAMVIGHAREKGLI